MNALLRLTDEREEPQNREKRDAEDALLCEAESAVGQQGDSRCSACYQAALTSAGAILS